LKIKDLHPGSLLCPKDGFVWVITPWRGTGGAHVGSYLRVVSERYNPATEEETKKDNVLYLGNASSIPVTTPGKQVVLAWGEKMTVDPMSWRNIRQIS
jgi:hypothetical protein